jgi:hypothetical protein
MSGNAHDCVLRDARRSRRGLLLSSAINFRSASVVVVVVAEVIGAFPSGAPEAHGLPGYLGVPLAIYKVVIRRAIVPFRHAGLQFSAS